MTAFIANTNVLQLEGLKNSRTGEFINDADVEVTIKRAGAEIAGETWPLAMSYVADSDGDYVAILSHELPFTRADHIAIIDANGGDDLIGHWEFAFRPLVRVG